VVVRWSEDTVDGRGARLHVRRVVEPSAPPILLLHGLGVGGAVWQPFARRLAPHLAAVAPDLRGHGQSDVPPEGYGLADYAADLAELTPAATPVVGHSLGALVAVALADGWPDRVSWLVLVDPPLDAERRNFDIPHVYELRHAPPGELEAYLARINPGGGRLLAEALAKLFRQASDAAFEAMLEAPRGSPETWARAPRLKQPCLVIQANPERGGVLGDAAAGDFVAQLPAGRLHKIDGPHALHASHPAEVAQAILDFGGYSSAASSASSPDSR
jgi:pimeloyl-ACP methyl ester carboxylesterase